MVNREDFKVDIGDYVILHFKSSRDVKGYVTRVWDDKQEIFDLIGLGLDGYDWVELSNLSLRSPDGERRFHPITHSVKKVDREVRNAYRLGVINSYEVLIPYNKPEEKSEE